MINAVGNDDAMREIPLAAMFLSLGNPIAAAVFTAVADLRNMDTIRVLN